MFDVGNRAQCRLTSLIDQANALTTYLHYESTPPPTWRAESVGCPGTVVTARNVRAIHVTGFTGVVDCLSVWCGVRVTVDIAEDQTVLYDRQRTVTYVRTTPEKNRYTKCTVGRARWQNLQNVNVFRLQICLKLAMHISTFRCPQVLYS